MSNADDLIARLRDFRLAAGSHASLDGLGNVCVNEAAIVAAGFEYKAVQSARDCPPCFSRPIAAYAITLNDRMDDETRNELLLPFVTRLAGTADTEEVERLRIHHMATRGMNLILPIVMRASKREDMALLCEGVKTLAEAREVAGRVSGVMRANAYADAATAAAAARRQVWIAAAQILDEAICTGNQGDAIAVDIAVQRMNIAKRPVAA